MDSYIYRDSARSPGDRIWSSRDDPRVKEERDSFYRGRSPGHDRARRSNRSRSPPPVDRYEPRNGGRVRDEYAAPRDRERDDRRRVPSPPANIDRYVPGQAPDAAPAPVSANNPLPDPIKLNYQVGFSYFGEWWRAQEKIKEEKERARTGRRREPERPRGVRETQEERDAEKAKIQAAYDKYKEELQSKMAQTFVRQHKDEQWFRERYVPEVRDPLRVQLNEFRRGAYNQWEQDLESGTLDEFSLEGMPKSDGNGQGGMVEKEEGEATAANEVLGVGDLVPVSSAEVRDENLYQPTLLIKTIAPSVSRQNLEAFCKEHLGEDEGGFKWLSLSDPNPSKRYHRIGWIMLHPAAESAATIDRVDPKEEDIDMALKSPVLVSTAEKALDAINSKTVKDEVRGDFVCHVGVHNPPTNPRRKALWDLFSAPERIDKDLELVRRLVNKFEESFGSDFNAILRVEEKVEDLKNSGRLQVITSASSSKKKMKKERMLGLDEAMDEGEQPEDLGEDDDEEGMIDDEEGDDEDMVAKKKHLDLLIEYLRRVFNFCFFCVFESDSVHELTRKCPGGHLRRPRTTLSSAGRAVARASALGEPFPVKKRVENTEGEEGEVPSEGDRRFRPTLTKAEQQLQRAYNWVKTFEDKILQLLEPESVDMRKVGGKPIDDAVDEELVKFVKQEDEHKWRCKVPECAKLFKEDHFWKKHVEKRHVEWLDKLREEFELINRYVIDPSHIAPSRTDANSNGHFPPANGQTPTGTPRGFNLQNFTMNNMLAMPGFGMQAGFPPNFLAAMPAMSAWTPGGADDRSGGGPIRRGGPMGGNRFHNNRASPYDRRPNPRWGQDGVVNGMMGGRGGRSYGGGRWGDGAGGGAAVGPREAIQGRSIKSYEDLDQVSGGGGGELNY
ncbi:arsenite resistance protein Ars2 [Gaeumannomyces tritici R3-111a-1]|uniref:Arsenite resistance protein Ars2 n=1 Tax=Gaeumannomyces tritici (strain R3-111a-1) TaxID=644352 RepID=J3NK10_GAET3|nr:arsenite resistance protein Ars2 [Gaeumannomyces tritici R3-111a-1]EJT81614.1 arsenite resistance protein Ars2 [Gaeumannomyces tritici R3-111a-1]